IFVMVRERVNSEGSGGSDKDISSRRSVSRSPRRSISHSPDARSNSGSPKRNGHSPDKNRSESRSPRRRSRSKSRSRSASRSPPRKSGRGYKEREPAEPSRCIGVFGMSTRTKDEDLESVFSKFGAIEKVTVVKDSPTGCSRGYGFIYFKDIEDAIKAKNEMNGQEIDGRNVRVDYSVTKGPHDPTPGVYKGNKPSRRDYRDRRYSPRRYGSRRSRSPRYSDRRDRYDRDYRRDDYDRYDRRDDRRGRYDDDRRHRRSPRYDRDRRGSPYRR
uniref:RRM domain-containing protein n=2 Tax=Strongyloides stercoralis TaxID=6248 RepID=A0AAF5HYR0_STRER